MRIESGASGGTISVSFNFVSYPFLPAVEKWLGRNPPAGPFFLAAAKALFGRRKGRTPGRNGGRVDVSCLGEVAGVVELIGFIVI